jgi:hypothetical protein
MVGVGVGVSIGPAVGVDVGVGVGTSVLTGRDVGKGMHPVLARRPTSRTIRPRESQTGCSWWDSLLIRKLIFSEGQFQRAFGNRSIGQRQRTDERLGPA